MKKITSCILTIVFVLNVFLAAVPKADAASNDYTSWKQYDSAWSSATPWPNASIPTFGGAGCYITSVAILLRHYNVVTDSNVNSFNPLICNNRLMEVGAVDSAGDMHPNLISNAYPGFTFVGSQGYSIDGLRNLLNAGYACIVAVKGYGHYVAIRSVNGSSVEMMDPGSSATDLHSRYGSANAIIYFKTSGNANVPSSDRLSLSGANYPSSVSEGSVFSVFGTVSSESSNLSSVTVGVYDTVGNMKTGKTVNPNSRSYNIHNVDNDIRFDYLSGGTYYYKITAANASGSETLLDRQFSVTPGKVALSATKIVTCRSKVALPVRVVDLYANVTDTSRMTYFDYGPTTVSPSYAVMSDGSVRYRIDANHKGVITTLWFQKADDIQITAEHTFGLLKHEQEHPHKTYYECECGYKKYTGETIYLPSCEICNPPKIEVEKITLNKKSITLIVGDTTYLAATVAPSSATDKTIRFVSGSSGIAQVDSHGKVTAISPGETWIQVYAGSIKEICEVSVKEAVDDSTETDIPTETGPTATKVHFKKATIYSQGQFSDVAANQWFTDSVASAFEYGLMKGNSATTFSPYGDVTIAEAITMAARIHSIYSTGTEEFKQTGAWYQVYLDYALKNNIISKAYYNCDVKNKATRVQFAEIFANALPEKGLSAINSIADNAIPDVKSSNNGASAVYKLYRAGILTGSDVYGTFSPDTYITRAEAAAIVSRMAESDNRRSFKLLNSAD